MLEHHAHLAAVDIDIDLGVGYIDAVEYYLAAGGILHAVEAAEECALTGAGGADDDNDITLIYRDIDALEHFVLPKLFWRSITSITLLQAPFHNFDKQGNDADNDDIDERHRDIGHHEFIAV